MPAEQPRPAPQDRHEHFQMQPRKPAAAAGDECWPRGSDDIGQLDSGPLHDGGSGFVLANELRQPIQRIHQILHVLVGEVDIARRLLQVVMAEQFLNGAKISSLIVQVRGKAMAQRIIAMLMNFTRRRSAIVITLSTA